MVNIMSLCYRADTVTVNCGLQKGGHGELIGKKNYSLYTEIIIHRISICSQLQVCNIISICSQLQVCNHVWMTHNVFTFM